MDILGYGILFAVLAGALRVFIEMLLYKKYYKDDFSFRDMLKPHDLNFVKKSEERYKYMCRIELQERFILISGEMEQHKVLPFCGTLISVVVGMFTAGVSFMPKSIPNEVMMEILYQIVAVFFIALGIQLVITVYFVMQIVSYNAIQKSVIEYVLKCRGNK